MSTPEADFAVIELDNFKTDLSRHLAEAQALHEGAWLAMRDGGDREKAKRDADESQAILRECLASTGRLMLTWFALAMKVKDPPEWFYELADSPLEPVERRH